ncbi:hypothetical protein FGO68_gene15214 [Halteria grandinella]|uniref:Uncharacterized protein n=1 Tax=Halteria grandinella TaxID=5974 RepID=A0A8J8NFH8_HALGN|nr:hypothetical protein FGO68_gene15214 [Halteria grandinella]
MVGNGVLGQVLLGFLISAMLKLNCVPALVADQEGTVMRIVLVSTSAQVMIIMFCIFVHVSFVGSTISGGNPINMVSPFTKSITEVIVKVQTFFTPTTVEAGVTVTDESLGTSAITIYPELVLFSMTTPCDVRSVQMFTCVAQVPSPRGFNMLLHVIVKGVPRREYFCVRNRLLMLSVYGVVELALSLLSADEMSDRPSWKTVVQKMFD